MCESNTRKAGFVDVALFVLAALLLGTPVFVMVKVQRFQELPTTLQIIIFAALPLASVALSALIFLATARVKKRLFLLICSSVVALYVGEILLSSLAYMRLSSKTVNSPDFDTRSKLEVLLDLRRQGIDAYPAIYPKDLLAPQDDGTFRSLLSHANGELLPLGGIARKRLVVCNESGQYLTYDSDRHGFHNPAGIWDRANITIAALGDSFTQGFCVCSDKNFVAHIRDRYPATLNLGAAGNGPLMMLAGIREYLPQIKPAVVLWCHYEGNDLVDLELEKKNALLMAYLDGVMNQGLQSLQEVIDRECAALAERRISELMASPQQQRRLPSAGVTTLPRLRRLLRLGVSFPPLADHTLVSRILSKAQASVQSWGGKLHIVYLPQASRYDLNLLGRGRGFNKNRERLLSEAAKLGIPVIDVHEAFRSHEAPLSLFVNRPRSASFGHYTEQGNTLVAEAVLAALNGLDKNR